MCDLVHDEIMQIAVAHASLIFQKVVLLGFYALPTAKAIGRQDLGLKVHPKDCFRKDFQMVLLY